ncbi:MAG: hypothetical protein LIP16_17495 [Clostridium sp.]|nr:hypothetical protein [Clostridium sp.]
MELEFASTLFLVKGHLLKRHVAFCVVKNGIVSGLRERPITIYNKGGIETLSQVWLVLHIMGNTPIAFLPN